MIAFKADTVPAQQMLDKLVAGIAPDKIDPLVELAARKTQAALVTSTPKKWFGQARAGWTQPASVVTPGTAQRIVQWNAPPGITTPIMLFLEEGTAAHGPVEKQALFIPLTRRAANATQGNFRVGQANGRAAIFQRTQSVRRGQVREGERALIYGVDYILAKRVAGISARHIVAQQKPKSRDILKQLIVDFVRNLIKS